MNAKLSRLKHSPPSAFAVLFAVGFAAGVLLILILPSHSSSNTTWRGYFTIVAGDNVADSVVTRALEKAGLSGVISASNATVSFTDFSGIKKVTIADIPERFDPVDPRLDPYMKRVSALFTTVVNGQAMQILYVPVSGVGTHLPGLGVLRVNSVAHRALDPLHITWYLLEWNGLRRVLFIVSFLVFCALLLIRTRHFRVSVLLGALPWVSGAFAGGYGSFAASCLLVFAWAYLLEEGVPAIERSSVKLHSVSDESMLRQTDRFYSRELGARFAFFLVAVVVAAVLDYDGVSRMVARVLPGVLATAALAGLVARYVQWTRSSREHESFIPLRILPHSMTRTLRGSYSRLVPSLLFVLVFPPLVMLILPGDAQVYVPRPVPVAGITSLSWNDLGRLWERHAPSTLPDLSDYITHRAYQDAYLFNRPYEFPHPGQIVTIPEFTLGGLNMSEHPKVMMTFTDSWFKDQMHGGGVPALLRSQGRAMMVERQPSGLVYADYAVLLRHTAIVLLVFFPFILSFVRMSMRIRFGLRDTFIRKRRLVA